MGFVWSSKSTFTLCLFIKVMDSSLPLSGRATRLCIAGTNLCIIYEGGEAEVHDLSLAALPPQRLSGVHAAAFVLPAVAGDEQPVLCATLGTEPSRPLLRLHDVASSAEVAQLRAPATVGMAPYQLASTSATLCVVGAVFGTAAIFEVRIDASGATSVALIATAIAGSARARSGGCTSALLTSSHLLLGHKDGSVLTCSFGRQDDVSDDAAAAAAAAAAADSGDASESDRSPVDAMLLAPTPPELSPPATPPPSPPSPPSPPAPPQRVDGDKEEDGMDGDERESILAGSIDAALDGELDDGEVVAKHGDLTATDEGEGLGGDDPSGSPDCEVSWLQPTRVLSGLRCMPFAAVGTPSEPDAVAIVALHLLRRRCEPLTAGRRAAAAAHAMQAAIKASEGASLATDVLAVDAAGRLSVLTLGGRSSRAQLHAMPLHAPVFASVVCVPTLRPIRSHSAGAEALLVLDAPRHTLVRLPLGPAYAALDTAPDCGEVTAAGAAFVEPASLARRQPSQSYAASVTAPAPSRAPHAPTTAALPDGVHLEPDLSALLRSGASAAAWVDGGPAVECLLLADGDELHVVHLAAPPLPAPPRPPPSAIPHASTASVGATVVNGPKAPSSSGAGDPSAAASRGGGAVAAPRWAPSPAAAAAAAAAAAGGPRLGVAPRPSPRKV